jgi:hypothetical protein
MYITQRFIGYPDINILEGLVTIFLALDGALDVTVKAVQIVQEATNKADTGISKRLVVLLSQSPPNRRYQSPVIVHHLFIELSIEAEENCGQDMTKKSNNLLYKVPEGGDFWKWVETGCFL